MQEMLALHEKSTLNTSEVISWISEMINHAEFTLIGKIIDHCLYLSCDKNLGVLTSELNILITACDFSSTLNSLPRVIFLVCSETTPVCFVIHC